jgi:exodeoxyribonuclease-5
MTEFHFQLSENRHKHTLFIVDEASMIYNTPNGQSVFGSGSLLDDLINYVYTGEGCRLLIMGDEAQLPPVGEPFTPALERSKLESYGLQVFSYSLTQVVRQSEKSGILHNATLIRNLIAENPGEKPKFQVNGFQDIKAISGENLIDTINTTYNENGHEDAIVITRSNKLASIYNKGIRNQVLQKEEELSNSDLLMVVKNNYFWSKNYDDLEFIANGDILEVVRIRKHHNMYGFRFVDVTLRFLDFDQEIDARLIIDSLYAENPAELDTLNKKLFEQVSEDYADIGNKRERMKQIMENPYMNALQVKFSYAVTCHKAQGGQWHTVFIDQGKLPDELPSDYLNWLYTALTRATNQAFLINFPKEFYK